MSAFKGLWAMIKPVLGIEEGLPLRKWAVKAGMKQATKLTPNLSKTLLYGKKSTRGELGTAVFQLLTGRDELGKKFQSAFSEALKIVNLKTKLLIEEKSKIAVELGNQEKFKEDEISKMSTEEVNVVVEEIIDNIVDEKIEQGVQI